MVCAVNVYVLVKIMLKSALASCILFLIKSAEARTNWYPTSCQTFDVKSAVAVGEERYYKENGNGFGEYVCCRPTYPTLYSYAECSYDSLQAGRKLNIYNEDLNLKYIVFKDSNITLIPVGLFTTYSNLTQLFLNSSGVKIVHPGAFTGLVRLQELYLQNNNISEITRGTLNSLTQLRILDISNSSVNIIEENALLGLFNLNQLNLSHNKLENLSSNLFDSLRSICFLDLSHNRISEISSTLLSNLSYHGSDYSPPFAEYRTHALSLDLSHNFITALNFSQLPISLQNLSLSYNQISSLEHLLELPKLERLDVSHNQITEIDVVHKNLKYLNLSGNKICGLNDSLFRESQNLVTLDVSFNFISNLHEDGFLGLSSLKHLYLQNNNLDKLPIGCFRNLNSLVLLNMSNNEISEFEFGTFSGLLKLENLDISNNTLTYLFESTFHMLTSLQVLNINNNLLTTFDSYDLLQYTKNLRMVSLNNNLWSCKALLDIIKNFDSKEVQILKGSTEKARNIRGIACMDYSFNNSKEVKNYMNNNVSYETSQKLIVIAKELDAFKRLFIGDFLNSSFYKYFQSYENSNFSLSLDLLKSFDENFKNTTFYQYFEKDISNATLFRHLNKALHSFSEKLHEMDTSLNTSLHKFSNSNELMRGFSKYFDDGFKNSTFYQYFAKEFGNSSFFKQLNKAGSVALNSTLIDISSDLRALRDYFHNDFKNSTFYKFFEKDYANLLSNFTNWCGLTSDDVSNDCLNASASFDRYTSNYGQQRDREMLAKLSDLQNGITTLMIIIIIILSSMMVFFVIKKISNCFTRSGNAVVSRNSSAGIESRTALELI